jgi:hypothetical protein
VIGERLATELEAIWYFEWQYVFVNIESASASEPFKMTLGTNRKRYPISATRSKFVEFPEPRNTHVIGAVIIDGLYERHFRGFIKTFDGYFSPGDYDLTNTCGIECSVCSLSQACFGFCNWNHYFNGATCKRCPLWCKSGCEDGKC